MRTTTPVAVMILVLHAGTLFAGDDSPLPIRIRPVQIVSWDTVPQEALSGLKFLQYRPGFQVSYLLEGADLIGVKADSLSIQSILTPDGKDISKRRNGKPAYQMGFFRGASDDGKYCVFSLEVEDNQFGKVERLFVKGSIIAFLGAGREEKKLELDVSNKEAKKVGPFSVEVGKGSAGGPFGALFGAITPVTAEPVLQSGAQPTVSPPHGSLTPVPVQEEGQSNIVGVKVTGPMDGIIEAKFRDGDQELQSGCSWDSTTRTYSFPKPKSGKFTLTLSYWAELKEAKVQFEQPLAPQTKPAR